MKLIIPILLEVQEELPQRIRNFAAGIAKSQEPEGQIIDTPAAHSPKLGLRFLSSGVAAYPVIRTQRLEMKMMRKRCRLKFKNSF